MPRGRQRSWATPWPPRGKQQPRKTEPFPSVHNKPFQINKKKKGKKQHNFHSKKTHSSVQFNCSVMSDSLQPHGLQHPRLPCPSPTPESCSNLSPFESVMPSNHLILCHPLLLLPSIFPSLRVFSNESTLRIRWPKFLSFSFSISPSNEYSELISFLIDWFDLLAVQKTTVTF